MLTWGQRSELSKREKAKLEGKVSTRVCLLVSRLYLWAGNLEKPLEQVTDDEFLSCYAVGLKTLEEIRKVIPAPAWQ